MQELIKTSAAVIGGEEVNAVNARELWKALGSKRRYSDWIKDRLEGFVEGKDFAVHKKMNGKNISLNSGQFLPTEYFITFDVAKHIAMLEHNEQGYKIRQYFIEVENRFRKTAINAEALVAAILPTVRENERLRARLEIAQHFMPLGKPGDLNEKWIPKTQFRRGYYVGGKGRSISALIEHPNLPGLFEEVKLRSIDA